MEVREAMKGYSKGSVPSNLKGYWTFDEYVEMSGTLVPSSIDFSTDTARMVFPNWGSGGNYAVGYYTSVNTITDDGTSYSTLVEPFLGDQPDVGCPIIPSSYVIETTPTWRSVGGTGSIVKGSNTSVAGSATVSNSEECNPFRVYLKLTNSWGSSEELFVDLIVDLHTNVGSVKERGVEMSAYPNPFEEQVRVMFAEEGEYTLLIYDVDGVCVNTQTLKATAGEVVEIVPEGESGVYLIEVVSGGKNVKSFKLLKK